MKKLLVTVIGAAAALGASADLLNPQRFEGMSQAPTTVTALNTQAGDAYWAELWATNTPPEATNTYAITAYDGSSQSTPPSVPDYFKNDVDPLNALSVKTTFGKPLTFNAIAGGTATNINAGIYFDSLVKFTVCEDAPEQDYGGAKIVMWLQEQYDANQDITGTNLMVKAGFLTVGENGIEVSNAVYKCGNRIAGDFADKWHRVTIKAIANITKSDLTVPGFAIYIDESTANTLDAKWDSTFSGAYQLTYTASQLAGALFPSMVQGVNGTAGKDSLTSASFDGTGFLNDLVFTDTAPDFAEDPPEPAPNTMSVTIGSAKPQEVATFADAVALANAQSSGTTVTIQPLMDVELAEPVEFSGEANIVLDFAGYVITNSLAGAAITNSAKSLIVMNSTGKGGINCTSTGGAIYQTNAEFPEEETTVYSALSITGGCFWGGEAMPIDVVDGYEGSKKIISGGYFEIPLDIYLADGKIFDEPGEDGLCEVIDYVPTFYTVTFMNGEAQFATTNVLENTVVVAPSSAPTKTGYTFAYWYTDNEADEYDFDTPVTGALTLTAKFTIDTYTVTFKNGEDTFATTNVTYNTVAVAPSPAPTKTGYTFAYWYTSDEAVEYNFATPVTGVLTLNAKFNINTYTVTFKNGEDTFATTNVAYNTVAVAPSPAPTKEGYTFNYWYTADEAVEYNFATPVTAALTLNAKFTSSGPTPIDPSADTPSTVVTAGSESDAISKATIAAPSGVDPTEYKSNFDFEAKPNGGGTYTVTMTGIKESVKTEVSEDAVGVLTSATGTGTVDVPAGLYYRITRYTAIGTAVVETPKIGQSTGSGVSVDKPGDTQGFIKVEMATKPFN